MNLSFFFTGYPTFSDQPNMTLPTGSVFSDRSFEVKSLAKESGFEYRGKASPRGWGWRAKNGITGLVVWKCLEHVFLNP